MPATPYRSNQYWEQAGFDEAADRAATMTTEQVRLAVAGAQTAMETATSAGRRHQCLGRLRGYRQALLVKERSCSSPHAALPSSVGPPTQSVGPTEAGVEHDRRTMAALPATQRATLTVAFEWTAGAGWTFNTTDMAPEACLTLRGAGEGTEVMDMLAGFFDAACVRLDKEIGDPGMAAPLGDS